MRRPRAKISVEWVDFTKRDVMVLVVMVAIGLVFAKGWSRGSSVFGFESPFWDLGAHADSRRTRNHCRSWQDG